ncbi:hypothetical protein QEN19_000942 [Hanseniaspora menglaensis]
MLKVFAFDFKTQFLKPNYVLKHSYLFSNNARRAVSSYDSKYTPENYQKLYNSLSSSQKDIMKTPEVKMPKILKTFTEDQIHQSEYERYLHISNTSNWLLKTNSPKLVSVAELFRIDKPTGTYLLLTPCIWSITMASTMLLSSYHGLTPPIADNVSQFAIQTALFVAGAYIMRSAGCVVNDMHDRELDFKVWRSLQRPMACGRISYVEAWAALIALSLLGVAILYYGLPWQCWWLGLASLPLVFIYPLFKRFTYYPQIVLSSCFNWGSLLGFAAILGSFVYPYTVINSEKDGALTEEKSLEIEDLPWRSMGGLYVTTFLWCMIYDTIYAHQDKKFDIKANIKSTALKWGSKTKPILYVMAFVQCLALFDSFDQAGLIGQTKLLSTSSMLAFDYLLFNMIYRVNLDNPNNCWYYFKRNLKYGQVITLGLLLEYFYQIFKSSKEEEKKLE